MDIRKIYKLGFLMLFFGSLVLIYFLFNPSEGFFIPCPFYYLTGFYCPGCGSQRAVHSLLHGDILGALRFNPLMVLTVPIIVYGLGIVLANWVFGTNYRFMLFYSKLFIYGLFGLAILFWIIRNIPIYPFNLLAPSS